MRTTSANSRSPSRSTRPPRRCATRSRPRRRSTTCAGSSAGRAPSSIRPSPRSRSRGSTFTSIQQIVQNVLNAEKIAFILAPQAKPGSATAPQLAIAPRTFRLCAWRGGHDPGGVHVEPVEPIDTLKAGISTSLATTALGIPVTGRLELDPITFDRLPELDELDLLQGHLRRDAAVEHHDRRTGAFADPQQAVTAQTYKVQRGTSPAGSSMAPSGRVVEHVEITPLTLQQSVTVLGRPRARRALTP